MYTKSTERHRQRGERGDGIAKNYRDRTGPYKWRKRRRERRWLTGGKLKKKRWKDDKEDDGEKRGLRDEGMDGVREYCDC